MATTTTTRTKMTLHIGSVSKDTCMNAASYTFGGKKTTSWQKQIVLSLGVYLVLLIQLPIVKAASTEFPRNTLTATAIHHHSESHDSINNSEIINDDNDNNNNSTESRSNNDDDDEKDIDDDNLFTTTTTTPSSTITSPSDDVSMNVTTTTTPTEKIPEWKQVLPPPLNNKTKTLQRIIVPGPGNRCVEIYLLGTAHVSKDSSRDVRLLLETIRPNVIFLELCDSRIPMLIAPPPKSNKGGEQENENGPVTTTDNDSPTTTTTTDTNHKSFWGRRRSRKNQQKQEKQQRNSSEKAPRSMYSTAASLLTNMQQEYADSLGVELGGEFRVAYEYWNENRNGGNKPTSYQYNNNNNHLHMILGDRPLYLTLTRAWESLRLWGKTKLIFGLLLSTFQKPDPKELKEWMESILSDDTGDLLTQSIAELAQHFPTLEEIIIRERDAYMACKMYQTCRELLTMGDNDDDGSTTRRHRMVAIVGAGHVEGMCKWLTQGGGTNETPEQIITRLIQIKKKIPEQDSRYLAYDVLELNHDLLQEMIEQQQQQQQQ